MKYQNLFSGKNKKNITNLSSAELAKRVVKVKKRDQNPTFFIYLEIIHFTNLTRLLAPCNFTNYHIRPNYRTVCLGSSKLQDTLICSQICIYLLRIHYKKDQKRLI